MSSQRSQTSDIAERFPAYARWPSPTSTSRVGRVRGSGRSGRRLRGGLPGPGRVRSGRHLCRSRRVENRGGAVRSARPMGVGLRRSAWRARGVPSLVTLDASQSRRQACGARAARRSWLGRAHSSSCRWKEDNLSQAYDYVEGSPQAALLSFVRSEPSHIESAQAGIDFLLSSCPDEGARRDILDALDWAYSPPPGELSAFLTWARSQLAQAASGNPRRSVG
jgi:hypothetical protein